MNTASIWRRKLNILGAGNRRYRGNKIVSRHSVTGSFRNPKVFNRKTKPPRKAINWHPSRKSIGNLFIVLIILFGVYLVFISSYFRVTDVLIEGNKTIVTEDLKSLVPKGNNIILMNTKPIKDAIIARYPQIKDIAIFKGLPNAIKVQIVERQATLVWVTNGKRYLIDPEGVVSREISEAESSSLPIVSDIRNIPVQVNGNLLSPDFIAFVTYVNNHFYEITNIKPTGYFVDETTYDLTIDTDANITVYLETVRSPDSQLENLKSLLASYRDKITQYVDLRVEGWGYYH